jgi:hypothetical protein
LIGDSRRDRRRGFHDHCIDTEIDVRLDVVYVPMKKMVIVMNSGYGPVYQAGRHSGGRPIAASALADMVSHREALLVTA